MNELRVAALIAAAFLPGIAMLELIELRRRGCPVDWWECVTSLLIAFGQHFSATITLAAYGDFYELCWAHRLWTVPMHSSWGIPLLLVAMEFLYYWGHRLSHRCRWFWASHAVHHSPHQLNLSGAYRLGWTAGLSGLALFPLPLVLLGYTPAAIAATLGANLIYQFWLHTELVPSLGPLERWLNTPSNHRAHHAVNPRYLDRNFGGVLIVFDRMFGTWERECPEDPCRYGLIHPVASNNPLVIVFYEWTMLLRDCWRAPSWTAVVRVLLGPPE